MGHFSQFCLCLWATSKVSESVCFSSSDEKCDPGPVTTGFACSLHCISISMDSVSLMLLKTFQIFFFFSCLGFFSLLIIWCSPHQFAVSLSSKIFFFFHDVKKKIVKFSCINLMTLLFGWDCLHGCLYVTREKAKAVPVSKSWVAAEWESDRNVQKLWSGGRSVAGECCGLLWFHRGIWEVRPKPWKSQSRVRKGHWEDGPVADIR